MSTKLFLESLDLDQLRYARRLADEMIKAKEAEPRKIVWQVHDGHFVMANFRQEDYLKALDRLVVEGKELDAACPAWKDPEACRLRIEHIYVPASEYERYVGSAPPAEGGAG